MTELQQKIIELYRPRGGTRLAKQLGCTNSYIYQVLDCHKRGRSKYNQSLRLTGRRNRDQVREREILAMRERGMTLLQIGKLYDITRERVRQIIYRSGETPTQPPSAADVAKLCGVTYERMLYCLRKGLITAMPGLPQRFTPSQLEDAKAYFSAQDRHCRLCGKAMPRNNSQGSGTTFCRECHVHDPLGIVAIRNHDRATGQIKDPRPRTLAMIEACKNYSGPNNTYESLWKVKLASGLTTMQIVSLAVHLKCLKTITNGRFPAKSRDGRSYRLYHIGQAIAAGRVCRQFKNERQRWENE